MMSGLGKTAFIVGTVFAVVVAAEEEASPVAIAISATLLGSISFLMGLYCFTNHPDEDMRRYTYEVISQTVSIFCAVLLFQSISGLVEATFLEGHSTFVKVLGCFVHMLFWYTIMQLSLAYITGAVGKKPKSIEACENDLKCYAVLLAHMTGFASVTAWGSLQQLHFFKLSPLLSVLVVPISFLGQFLLQRCTNAIRVKVSKGDDGIVDEFEAKWDEETEECENDVMGLTLSFNLCQALRFLVNSALPDKEGKLEETTNVGPGLVLLSFAFMFVAATAALYWKYPPKEEEGEEDEEEKNETPKENGGSEAGSGEEEEDSTFERTVESATVTFMMVFAWCMFFSIRRFICVAAPVLSKSTNEMLLAVVLALVLSLMSFGSIRGLDKMADAKWSDAKVDAVIKHVISAFGIVVGFGWEQCFDAAVDSLASGTPAPGIAKLVLAIFCCVLIIPAWKWWILPMVLENGWKFGFVIDAHPKWHGVQKTLNKVLTAEGYKPIPAKAPVRSNRSQVQPAPAAYIAPVAPVYASRPVAAPQTLYTAPAASYPLPGATYLPLGSSQVRRVPIRKV